MRGQKANYVEKSSPWDRKPKYNSRIITIIEAFFRIFKKRSLPKDRQFVTLCGKQTRNGQQIRGELNHLINGNLILPYQYIGIDREKEIIEQNEKVYPGINWIHGDFLEVLENMILEGVFNPSIINYDGVMQPRKSSQYLKKIMSLLDYNFSPEVMLVTNFVLTNPYINSDRLDFNIHDALKELKSIYSIPDHWELHEESYSYKHSKADMGVLIFIKHEHNIKKFNITSNRIIGCKKEITKTHLYA